MKKKMLRENQLVEERKKKQIQRCLSSLLSQKSELKPVSHLCG